MDTHFPGSHTTATTPPASRPPVAPPGAETPTEDRFAISVTCSGPRWCLRVSGLLDAAGASAMVDIAEVLSARRAAAVDLDLSEVTEIDPLGWRAASYAETLLVASGADCRLISPPPRRNHPAKRPSHGARHAA